MPGSDRAEFSCTPDEWVRNRTEFLRPVMAVAGVIIFHVVVYFSVHALFCLMPLIVGSAVLFPLFVAPVRYTLDGQSLTVEMSARTVEIPFSDVTDVSVRHYDYVFAGSKGGGIVAGVYGLLGRWQGSAIPDFDSYVVRRDTLVVVTRRTGLRAVVLSPDDPAGFVSAFQSRMSAPTVLMPKQL